MEKISNQEELDELFQNTWSKFSPNKETLEKFLLRNVNLESNSFVKSFKQGFKKQSNENIEYLIEKCKIKVQDWEFIFNYCQNPNLDLKTLQILVEGIDKEKEKPSGLLHQVKKN